MPRNKSEQEPVLEWECYHSTTRSQKLWRLGREYIITSKIDESLLQETSVFAADKMGAITSYDQLYGSQKGEWPHEMAIAAYYVYTRNPHLRKKTDAA